MWAKSMGKLFIACEWIMKTAYLNIIWIAYTIAGLLVFGFMPATTALFAVIRKWLHRETDIPVWRTFHTIYKQEFLKANLLGLFLMVIGVILCLDYWFLQYTDGLIKGMMTGMLLLLSAIFLTLLGYFFPIFVHYDLKLGDYLKYALLLGAYHLHITLLMLVLTIATACLLLYMPGLIPFYGGISIAWIWMAGGSYSFRLIEKRGGKGLAV
ncbi:YesL family protein [Niallia taxi]|uniref:DUF624 domain-containing protein n=1 Tax=Niallia taxi TaxID=2499688 RepID=A0A3S2TWH5_9BACI|nr:YesL family protein [Niallia taxi]MCM3217849.1 YesL family protein [Niallia taxi]MDK8638934.1 YesL family protein [Niallia taxi]MED4053444.1 YesL family protein [Niallia taxi]MED4119284.1 YesL family protein [Niallia taxi]RVT67361.1 DUF624 domain-containing protein [Niallia taxi]